MQPPIVVALPCVSVQVLWGCQFIMRRKIIICVETVVHLLEDGAGGGNLLVKYSSIKE